MRPQTKRFLYLLHRYLGIPLCLLFLMWFVSGVVMLYVRMPILTPEERFSYLQPLDSTRFIIPPAEAVSRAGLKDTPRRMRVGRLLDRPVYYILPKGEKWLTLFADDGTKLSDLTESQAAEVASRYLGGTQCASLYAGQVNTIDQWTLTNSLNLHRPLYRFGLNDPDGTEVYVSRLTGEVVMKSTRMERRLAWFGPIIHWVAPELLRKQVGAWRQFLIWASVAGTLVVISGVWIGLLRYRREGYKKRDGSAPSSPYTGWRKWHHWGGLVFGVATLTWIFSGLLYLNPGGSRSGPLETTTTFTPYNVDGIRANYSPETNQALAMSGGPLDAQLFMRGIQDGWKALPADAQIREVELARFAGTPYYIFYETPHKSWSVPADASNGGAISRFGIDELLEGAGRAVPEGKLTEATLLNEYDGYYYAVGAVAPKRLPVLRVKFSDPSSTWLYIDPHTGSIYRRYDSYGRWARWVINGFHCLDFPFLISRRPAWDITIILLSLGGFILSASAIVLSWRRAKVSKWPGASKQRKLRNEPVSA